MKKSNIALTALLTASMLINAGIVKADTQADRQEIIRKYNYMSEGCSAKIVEQCLAYWSDDFQGTLADGKTINLTEIVQNQRRFYQKVSQYRTRDEIIRVGVNGNRADVIGLAYYDYIIGNKRVNSQIPYEDVWVKTNNGWVLVYSRWHEANRREVAIGQPSNQPVPLPPSTSLGEMNNFMWRMPGFWNP